MTARELYKKLDEKIPRSLSYEWDNDGIMCCPDSSREVCRVLIALDVTDATVDKAIKGKYDVIISHHPFVFKGIKSLDDRGSVSAKAIKLLQAGIAVFSFHTRLDCIKGGVNDELCRLFELSEVESLDVDGLPLARVGTLKKPMAPAEFAHHVKRMLDAPVVVLSSSGIQVSRVCVVGGSGSDALFAARRAGADTLVSGRVGYHEMTDAPDFKEKPMNIIEAGHFYTESPVCQVLKSMTKQIDSSLECTVYNSCALEVL